MKRCNTCGAEKSLADFYSHPKNADGLLGRCKSCHKQAVTARRLAKLDEVRTYDRRRAKLPHRIELRTRISVEWRHNHPEARRAQNAVSNAVRDGRLQRWPCEICGKKAHAHHPDYSMPLVVVWLCPPHHKAAHQLLSA